MNGKHHQRSVLLLLVALALTREAAAQDLGPAPLLPESERVFQLRQLADVNVPAIDTSSRLATVAAFYSGYNASEGFAVG
jgi:hypothetical protein